ncbi:MAG: hypothetical protein N2689_02895 [Verrucomicrobiae bacterium]|nr:hypothetical protein [Verrucomicrobiae bacterium]
MRHLTLLLTCAVAAVMLGCVPSLHPLYTDKDLVFEPGLVGKWGEPDETDTWTFEKSGDKLYTLTTTAKGVPAKFEARLVRLGKHLFLDTYPEEPDFENGLYKIHLIRVHYFWKVALKGDTLEIGPLNLGWLMRMIDEKKIAVRHETYGDDKPIILLTASTKDLQALIARYADDPEAFGEKPAELRRVK